MGSSLSASASHLNTPQHDLWVWWCHARPIAATAWSHGRALGLSHSASLSSCELRQHIESLTIY